MNLKKKTCMLISQCGIRRALFLNLWIIHFLYVDNKRCKTAS